MIWMPGVLRSPAVGDISSPAKVRLGIVGAWRQREIDDGWIWFGPCDGIPATAPEPDPTVDQTVTYLVLDPPPAGYRPSPIPIGDGAKIEAATVDLYGRSGADDPFIGDNLAIL